LSLTFDVASYKSGSTTAITWSHTTTTENNRYLIVGVASGTGSTISGVTYKTVAMTQLAKAWSGSNNPASELWGLRNPDSGANDVVVTSATAPIRGTVCMAASYYNVNPYATIVVARHSGSSTAPGSSLSVTGNGLIVGCLSISGSATFVPAAEQNQRVNWLTGSSAAIKRGYLGDRLNVTGTQYVTGSLSAARRWAATSAALIEALPTDFSFHFDPRFTKLEDETLIHLDPRFTGYCYINYV
jgi:hypothetical protein